MPKIEAALQRAAYFIKDGGIVVKDGEVVSHGHKKTVWVKVTMPENPQVTRDVSQAFHQGTYTVDISNYRSANTLLRTSPSSMSTWRPEVLSWQQ